MGEHNFYSFEVDWQLERGVTYELIIEAQGNEKPAYLLMTIPEEMPLLELKNASLNDQIVYGQPICGIMYRKLPGKKNLLFIAMTWTWILFAIYLTGYSVMPDRISKKQRKDAQGQ